MIKKKIPTLLTFSDTHWCSIQSCSGLPSFHGTLHANTDLFIIIQIFWVQSGQLAELTVLALASLHHRGNMSQTLCPYDGQCWRTVACLWFQRVLKADAQAWVLHYGSSVLLLQLTSQTDYWTLHGGHRNQCWDETTPRKKYTHQGKWKQIGKYYTVQAHRDSKHWQNGHYWVL